MHSVINMIAWMIVLLTWVLLAPFVVLCSPFIVLYGITLLINWAYKRIFTYEYYDRRK